MKYIRVVSDIHLDADLSVKRSLSSIWFPIELPEDNETTLVIPGDLWADRFFLSKKYPDGESWLEKLSQRFKYVVFVLGNHDYWGVNISNEASIVKQEIKNLNLENVYLLEQDLVVLDQVKFVGGTLWTDYNKKDPMVMLRAARNFGKDFDNIKIGLDCIKLIPNDLVDIHYQTKKFIFDNYKKDNKDQKVCVVTHMAPSFQSVHPQFRSYKSQFDNFHYYSDIDYEIEERSKDIEWWLHGHMHSSSDYMIGGTRVICQPRGYFGYQMTDYDPTFRIEV